LTNPVAARYKKKESSSHKNYAKHDEFNGRRCVWSSRRGTNGSSQQALQHADPIFM
jgi:hypothetical protein